MLSTAAPVEYSESRGESPARPVGSHLSRAVTVAFRSRNRLQNSNHSPTTGAIHPQVPPTSLNRGSNRRCRTSRPDPKLATDTHCLAGTRPRVGAAAIACARRNRHRGRRHRGPRAQARRVRAGRAALGARGRPGGRPRHHAHPGRSRVADHRRRDEARPHPVADAARRRDLAPDDQPDRPGAQRPLQLPAREAGSELSADPGSRRGTSRSSATTSRPPRASRSSAWTACSARRAKRATSRRAPRGSPA